MKINTDVDAFERLDDLVKLIKSQIDKAKLNTDFWRSHLVLLECDKTRPFNEVDINQNILHNK